MADERPATVDDINQIRIEVRDIRSELTKVVESLGHVRVEIAKNQGDSRVVGARTLVIWIILGAIGSALMPIIIQRLIPTPVAAPAPIIVTPAPVPSPVPVPALPSSPQPKYR